MFNPFFSLEGHEDDSYNEYLVKVLFDDFASKPKQINSSSNIGKGGELGEFFSSHGFYSEKPPENYLNSSLMSEKSEHLVHKAEVVPKPGNKENNGCIRKHRASLSTEEVVRVASALFIQMSSLVVGDPTNLGLPFGLSTSTLLGIDLKNVELVTLLLAAADKVSNEQYSRATTLLRQCNMSSSQFGNPIQRVVYYFTDALQERIDRNVSSKRKERKSMTPIVVIKSPQTNHPLQLVANNALPFMQVLHFTATQVLLDNVSSAKRIHMIDFSIKYGQQWALFLQGLATRNSCPVESITISGVGEEEGLVNATGQRLSSFAESLNLPFKFRAVIVGDVKELQEAMFVMEEEETVGAYTCQDMNNLIVRPRSLDNLMRVMHKVKPSIITVIDVEANLNSPHFISRFTEALFFYSAYFDCIDSLMGSDENRPMIEGKLLAQGIKSTLANEGSERVLRYVGVNVWRAYFRRYGLREAKLSEWSVYQASLVIKQFVNDNSDSCTIQKNGKSLLVGWKGTPLNFVSAWKFSRGQEV